MDGFIDIIHILLTYFTLYTSYILYYVASTEMAGADVSLHMVIQCASPRAIAEGKLLLEAIFLLCRFTLYYNRRYRYTYIVHFVALSNSVS